MPGRRVCVDEAVCDFDLRCGFFSDRVATNLENLEYSESRISLNVGNSGNSQGILCNLREKL